MKSAPMNSKTKYPEQVKQLSEMGFDAKSINDALESTRGDLQAATAVLLGEPAAASAEETQQATKSVAPMKVVGKQATTTTKVAPKVDIKETHNKFMATYKVTKCRDKTNHDKRMCFFWHTKGDRRRNPFEVLYTCTECPNSSETVNCENGDSCLKAHNMLERMFHPDLFKISMCQRGPNGSHCERGNLCAFAHSDEDHRIPTSSHNAVKPGGVTGASAAASPATAQTGSAAGAPSASGAADTITAGKSMSDSRILDMIQDKLVRLIKNQGSEGIISSELPKRYFDAYSERLELADEAGEKFRIKDLLLSHAHISVTMHKGVQPKYVYEEVDPPAAAAATNGKSPSTVVGAGKAAGGSAGPTAAAVVAGGATPATSGVSYSAIANQNIKPAAAPGSAPVRAGPLNYAAAAAPAPTTSAATTAPMPADAATAMRKRGPGTTAAGAGSEAAVPSSLLNKMGEISAAGSISSREDVVPNQWSMGNNASLLESAATSVGGSATGSPFSAAVAGRRRGPDGSDVTGSRLDTMTPPLPQQSQTQQSSPSVGIVNGSSSSTTSRLNISDLTAGLPTGVTTAGATTGSSIASSPGGSNPPGLSSSLSGSPSKHPGASTMVEFHERLSQASSTCDKLNMQVQLLQMELQKKNMEFEMQQMQLKSVLMQLSDSTDSQNKANSAKDSAVSEVFRARQELEELKAQNGDVSGKMREIANRDFMIAQMKQEKIADLSMFCHNLSQVESALVEIQRKEAKYINEIPLHDTINESCRARDELTKFVGMLKLQLNNKLAENISTAAATSNSNGFSKVAAGAPGMSSGNLGGLLNGISGSKQSDGDVFSSPLRPFGNASKQSSSIASFLNSSSSGHDSSSSSSSSSQLLGGMGGIGGMSSMGSMGGIGRMSGPLGGMGDHDDLHLMRNMMDDTDDRFDSLLLSATGAAGGSSSSANGSNNLMKGISGNVVVCALPGCRAEGTFICSACNRTGYCGAQHQR
jgi:hypothetical protein